MPQKVLLDPDVIAAQVKKDMPLNADEIADQVRAGMPAAPPQPPPPAPSGQGVLASMLPNYSAVADVAKGGLKGLLSTIQSGGNLIRSTTGMGGPSITLPISTQPTNTPQRVGMGLEQAAEYALPAEGMASATAHLPMLGRAVAQAGTAGTIAALQGKTPQEAGIAAATSGVAPVLGEAWPAVKDFVARKVTPRLLNALMEVNPKWLEFGRDPGGRVISEGLAAATKDGLATQIAGKTDSAGKALELYLLQNGQNKIINGNPIIDSAIDNATRRIGVGSDPAFTSKLGSIMVDVMKAAGGRDTLTSLSPLQAQRLKTAIGDSIKWHGVPYEGDINQTLAEMYRGLNQATEQAVPGAKAMMARYGDLKVAQNAIKDSINRDMTRGLGSMLTSVPTPAATVIGQLQRILMNPASNTASTALGRMGLGGVLSQQGQQ